MTEKKEYVLKQYKIKLDDYYPFGKLCIHKKSLTNCKLRVCYYPSLATYPKQKVVQISPELCDCFRNIILHGDHYDMSLFYKLSGNEQQIIIPILKKSGVDKIIGFKYEDSLLNRLRVLQGELATGNSNPSIITEAIQVIKDLVDLGRIKQSEASVMIRDLNS